LGGGTSAVKNVIKPIVSKTENSLVENSIAKDYVDNLFTSTKPNKVKYETLTSKGIKPEEELLQRGIVPEIKDGKAYFTKGRDMLQSEYDELNSAFDKQIQRYADFNVNAVNEIKPKIDSIIDNDPILARTGNKETIRKEVYAKMQKYIEDNGGSADFSLPQINDFKKGQYTESAKYKKSAAPDFTKSDASSVLARAFKETVEENADDVAVKSLNAEIGKLKDLITFVSPKGIEGTAVKGGRLGLYAGRTVGSLAGADKGIVGSILGALGGDAVARILQSNAVLGPDETPIFEKTERRL